MKRPIQAKNGGFYNYLSVKKYRNVVCAEGGEELIKQKNTQKLGDYFPNVFYAGLLPNLFCTNQS